MKLINTGFDDLWLIEPVIHTDARGYFFESYSKPVFEKLGLDLTFVQDNQSWSKAGVIRGLHFQAPPVAQAKLIRVLSGGIWDVVVDLRKNKQTFGKVYGVELSAANKLQLLVPKGFAHGFSVLTDSAEVLYKSDAPYAPQLQRGLRYNDPQLNINWRIPSGLTPLISEPDKVWPILKELESYF